MKILILLGLLTGLVSCSGSKSTSDLGAEEAGIQLADSDEFLNETPTEDVVADNMAMPMGGEGLDQAMPAEMASTPMIDEMGAEESYTVQKNETLMIIAFKLYGDYNKWRNISNLNGGISQINEGMVLKYKKPMNEFVWAPSGNPYLIKTGDTLGHISNTTYGTTKLWKNIWDNNKPLIKDPNKIFVGFTIYTPLIEGRDVANSLPTDL